MNTAKYEDPDNLHFFKKLYGNCNKPKFSLHKYKEALVKYPHRYKRQAQKALQKTISVLDITENVSACTEGSWILL